MSTLRMSAGNPQNISWQPSCQLETLRILAGNPPNVNWKPSECQLDRLGCYL